MANRLLNSVFVFQLGGIGRLVWWHNAVFAQINNHLAIVVRHVPDAHYAEAQAGIATFSIGSYIFFSVIAPKDLFRAVKESCK